MTSQATNRREGVSTSYRGHSRKLETMRAAHELLGVPTIGGGSARPEGGGGGSQRSQISLPNCPECTQKRRQNSWFPALINLT
jgi:hypothetical protein